MDLLRIFAARLFCNSAEFFLDLFGEIDLLPVKPSTVNSFNQIEYSCSA
jgi:hypothetical protein